MNKEMNKIKINCKKMKKLMFNNKTKTFNSKI